MSGGGVLFAKLGIFKAALVAFILQFISCGIMIIYGYTQWSWLGFLWSGIYGLTVYIYMSGSAILIQNLFGMKESSESLGVFSIFFSVGFAIGNVIFGLIVDKVGYMPAWYVNLANIVIGFVILLWMIKKISAHHYDEVDENV